MDTMTKRLQERLDLLEEISIPWDMEWADEHVPAATEYIKETYDMIMQSISENDEMGFKKNVERYEKACFRIWQLMAQDHFNSRDILDVSMVYYRHMPDGNSFVMDSKTLGFKIMVFPRKPKEVPEMKWITAGELIRIHKNPILLSVIKTFDAWYNRNPVDASALKRATELSKKDALRIRAAGGGLHLKNKKHGWDCYE